MCQPDDSDAASRRGRKVRIELLQRLQVARVSRRNEPLQKARCFNFPEPNAYFRSLTSFLNPGPPHCKASDPQICPSLAPCSSMPKTAGSNMKTSATWKEKTPEAGRERRRQIHGEQLMTVFRNPPSLQCHPGLVPVSGTKIPARLGRGIRISKSFLADAFSLSSPSSRC